MASLPPHTNILIEMLVHWMKSSKGQTLLEFAFVLPIMLVFLFVIVDFGIAIDRRIVLQHAVREGARKGAVTNNISAITDTTVAQSQGLLDPADVDVCYEDANANGNDGEPGDNVKVSATFTYEFTIPFASLFNFMGATVPSGISMTPSADMRLENSVNPAPPCT